MCIFCIFRKFIKLLVDKKIINGAMVIYGGEDGEAPKNGQYLTVLIQCQTSKIVSHNLPMGFIENSPAIQAC